MRKGEKVYEKNDEKTHCISSSICHAADCSSGVCFRTVLHLRRRHSIRSILSKSEDAQPVLWKCRKHKENTGKIQQLQYEYGYSLYFRAKRPGTTTLTIKVGNETKKVKAIVANYTNPVSSIKLGSTTISGRKFNKADKITASYAPHANKKVKVNVTGKKGWKVLCVDYLKKGWMKTERVKNGAKIPVNGGRGYIVMVTLENEKTGLQEMVQVTLN